MIDYSGFALAKPPAKRSRKPSHAIYRPDGTIERIVLSQTDWKHLTDWVWETELKINGLVRCHIGAHVIQSRTYFVLDHPEGRGFSGSHRDDRTVKPACWDCNSLKGSKRL